MNKTGFGFLRLPRLDQTGFLRQLKAQGLAKAFE